MSRRGFRGFMMFAAGGVGFAKLLGAIWTFEFMAFAGNAKHGNGHNKDGE